MPEITINNQSISIDQDSTILDAAKQLNVDIPTMCHIDSMKPFTSCMICVVQEMQSGKLLPACSACVQDGMQIETDNEFVHEARKTALELLLSEHVGDCEAPCQRICPAHMNIPRMIRQIQQGNYPDALITVKRHIALPATLGRICPAPCENGCRRKQQDAPVSICLLKRFVADMDLASDAPFHPERLKKTGKKVAIVGAGPAGLAAAYELAQHGHACTIIDENEEPGGKLRYATDQSILPRDVLAQEIERIEHLGVQFRLRTRVDSEDTLHKLCKQYDAVLLSIGSVDTHNNQILGVPAGKRGITVNPKSYATEILNVFACGGAIRSSKMAVTAVGDGRSAAISIHHFLRHGGAQAKPDRFNSLVGRIQPSETVEYMKEASDHSRMEPGRPADGFSAEEAIPEALRCLHCDCRKPNNCKLRDYSDEYGARQQTYRSSDRCPVEKLMQHEMVIYEPGKCIKCGLCVHITERDKERFGMTFIGRGFDVRIDVPLQRDVKAGLEKVAADVVKACPTGALAMKNGEQV